MLVIINRSGANFSSVKFAFERLGVCPVISDDPVVIGNASRIILPGVGSAAAGMRDLRDKKLDILIPTLKQPVLGICLGMQLLFECSSESNEPCLGIISGSVEEIASDTLIVPHMGWNKVNILKNCALLKGLSDSYAYFIHSFKVKKCAHTMASCDYGDEFSAVCQKDNFYGTQFHPEKSGEFGQKILENFMRITS